MAGLAYVCIFAAVLIASSVEATPFKQCENGPVPASLIVEGCDEAPCLFQRGKDVIAHWDFTVTSDTEMLKPRARAFVAGAVVEYPLPEKDGCKNLSNGRCPLDEGEFLTYQLKMPVLAVFPKIRLDIEFALLDENNDIQVCFVVDAQVV